MISSIGPSRAMSWAPAARVRMDGLDDLLALGRRELLEIVQEGAEVVVPGRARLQDLAGHGLDHHIRVLPGAHTQLHIVAQAGRQAGRRFNQPFVKAFKVMDNANQSHRRQHIQTQRWHKLNLKGRLRPHKFCHFIAPTGVEGS
jgi:hypothetical protein